MLRHIYAQAWSSISIHSIRFWASYCTISTFMNFHSLIHLAVCQTTGPKPLPKRAVHTVRSRASSFKWEYPLLSLWSSNSFLRLIPRLPVTSIPPFIFPSITRCRRQFLRKMWPILLAFRFLISCRIFLCSFTWLLRDNYKKHPVRRKAFPHV